MTEEIVIPSKCKLFEEKVALTDPSTGECAGVTNGALKVEALNQLVPETYDEIVLGYTGSDLTLVTYKLDSETVATLSLTYVSGNLTNVSRV